jgi:hypothetical protein
MKFQSRKNAPDLNADTLKENKKRQRDKDEKHKATGKKKKSGTTRYFPRNELYAAPIMELLKRAIVVFAELQGQETVYWNHVVELFDTILVKEYAKKDHWFTQGHAIYGEYW